MEAVDDNSVPRCRGGSRSKLQQSHPTLAVMVAAGAVECYFRPLPTNPPCNFPLHLVPPSSAPRPPSRIRRPPSGHGSPPALAESAAGRHHLRAESVAAPGGITRPGEIFHGSRQGAARSGGIRNHLNGIRPAPPHRSLPDCPRPLILSL